MGIVLQAKGVSKVYGTKKNPFTALKNLNLEVSRGDFVGIMGPSGSGKSTLLHLLSTIDTPATGSIDIGGKSILTMKEEELSDFRRNHLGFIFQDFNLLDTLNVKENILLPLALSNSDPSLMSAKALSMAKIFGIEEILEKYPYEISGGQAQRTAAARALITSPEMIYADEPTGALDSKSAATLLQTLAELNEQAKATILMVTHDAYAASYCSRILFIKDGEIFTEIRKGEHTRKEIFQQIINILTTLGGGSQYDII